MILAHIWSKCSDDLHLTVITFPPGYGILQEFYFTRIRRKGAFVRNQSFKNSGVS